MTKQAGTWNGDASGELISGVQMEAGSRGFSKAQLRTPNCRGFSPTPAQSLRSPTGVHCAHSWLFYTLWVDTL